MVCLIFLSYMSILEKQKCIICIGPLHFSSVGLEFKQDAIKFKLLTLSLDVLGRNDIVHRARLEERRGAHSLSI